MTAQVEALEGEYLQFILPLIFPKPDWLHIK
jgi:hypothetical protein